MVTFFGLKLVLSFSWSLVMCEISWAFSSTNQTSDFLCFLSLTTIHLQLTNIFGYVVIGYNGIRSAGRVVLVGYSGFRGTLPWVSWVVPWSWPSSSRT